MLVPNTADIQGIYRHRELANIHTNTGVKINLIVNNSALNAKLLSYWRLDEISGTRSDSKASNHLANRNNPDIGTGVIKGGVSLVALNTQNLNISDASQTGLDPLTSNFSQSCWVKVNNLGTSRMIFAKGASSDNATDAPGYRAFVGTNGGIYCSICDNANSTRVTGNTTSGQIVVGNWYFLTFVWIRASNLLIYKNGVQIQSIAINTRSGTIDVAAPFAIGSATFNSAPTSYSTYFDGIIDEFGWWSNDLTQSDIDYLYNHGYGSTYS